MEVEAVAYSGIAAVGSPLADGVGIPFVDFAASPLEVDDPFAGLVASPSEVEDPSEVLVAFPFAVQGCMDMGFGWDIPDPGIPGCSSDS